jgi:hypothetical protein
MMSHVSENRNSSSSISQGRQNEKWAVQQDDIFFLQKITSNLVGVPYL